MSLAFASFRMDWLFFFFNCAAQGSKSGPLGSVCGQTHCWGHPGHRHSLPRPFRVWRPLKTHFWNNCIGSNKHVEPDYVFVRLSSSSRHSTLHTAETIKCPFALDALSRSKREWRQIFVPRACGYYFFQAACLHSSHIKERRKRTEKKKTRCQENVRLLKEYLLFFNCEKAFGKISRRIK